MPQLRRSRKLPLVGPGFADFRVEGLVDDFVVKATWDGRCLALSESLYQRALLAVAVDEIFVETGLVPERSRSTLCGTPADVILTLARSCDSLHVVEYTRRCSDHR
ncbi:MAG: hypothetical protein QOE35_1960 [Actinomycetota bacterium]|jgi:hypothetical protein